LYSITDDPALSFSKKYFHSNEYFQRAVFSGIEMLHYHSYYQGFADEQFAADEYFQQWVLARDRHCDEFWQSYLNLNPMDSDTIRNARQLVEELSENNNYSLLPLSEEEKAVLKENIFQRLHIASSREKILSVDRKRTYRWLAAAAVLGIIAVSAFVLIKPKEETRQSLLSETTSNGEMKEIILPDSSIVILNAGSSLKYDSNFLNQRAREVFLEGNAFFNVKKDAGHKQFIVHAKSLAITVLGTQFNVNARSSATEVGLTSGKVKITGSGNSDSAFMLPGEKIRLDTVQQLLIRSTLDTQLYSAWTEHKWSFRQTTLEEITGLISEYYGVEVVYHNEKSKRMKVTAVIPVNNLEMLTRILSKTLHIGINQINNRLIIQ
jgi:transmembrane sensor